MKLSNPTKFILTPSIITQADIVCTAGAWKEFARYTGQINQVICLGFGPYDKANEAIGRAYMKLVNAAGAQLNGLVRIERHDAQDNFIDKVYEDRTESFARSTTPSEQLSMAIRKQGVGWNSYLVFLLKIDSTDTIDYDHASIALQIDATQFKAQYNM